MTRSSVADLEDDLRSLFAAQADAVDTAAAMVAPPSPTHLPVEADGRAGRRRAVTLATASVAATVAIVVGAVAIGRDAGRTDVRAGDQTTSAPPAPQTTADEAATTTVAPEVPTVDPIDSLDEFEARVEQVYRSPGARALLGEVVTGEATESRMELDDARSYGVNATAANGARGGLAAGDHRLPLGRPEAMLPGGTVIEPVALPAGIEEGVTRDNGQTVAVALRGDDQFVSLLVEKLDTQISPSMLIAIAGAFLVPPQPAPATGPAVSELGRFTATVLPDGFFESSVAERVDPTSASVTAHFLTGTDRAALTGARRLNVTTVRNTDADAIMADIGSGDGVATVAVKGHDAVLQVPFSPSLDPPADERSLVWAESPTMVVFVNGRGLSDAELLAVANGLRPR